MGNAEVLGLLDQADLVNFRARSDAEVHWRAPLRPGMARDWWIWRQAGWAAGTAVVTAKPAIQSGMGS
jgi:hypothetical protein